LRPKDRLGASGIVLDVRLSEERSFPFAPARAMVKRGALVRVNGKAAVAEHAQDGVGP